MNIRLILPLLFLVLLPGALRAQSAAARKGDTLDLRITGVPPDESSMFNATYPIDDNGMIALPLIDKIKVDGMLPNQIQEAIQKAYVEAKIYTHPTVTVQQNAMPRYVNVIGEVNSHGSRVQYTPDMTLMSVITACQGFTDFANRKKVELMRDGNRTFYNTVNISAGKDPDPKVLPGDQITVRQSFF